MSPEQGAAGESIGTYSSRAGIAVLRSARNVQTGYTRMHLSGLVPISFVPLAPCTRLLCFTGFLPSGYHSFTQKIVV